MSYYSICTASRLGGNGNTFEIKADIDNDKIDLVSEGKKEVISFDLICAANFAETFRELVNSKPFQIALSEKISEQKRRCNDANSSAK